MNKHDEKKDVKELTLDDIKQVSGGSAFADVPRVPTNPIDEELKEKV